MIDDRKCFQRWLWDGDLYLTQYEEAIDQCNCLEDEMVRLKEVESNWEEKKKRLEDIIFDLQEKLDELQNERN